MKHASEELERLIPGIEEEITARCPVCNPKISPFSPGGYAVPSPSGGPPVVVAVPPNHSDYRRVPLSILSRPPHEQRRAIIEALEKEELGVDAQGLIYPKGPRKL